MSALAVSVADRLRDCFYTANHGEEASPKARRSTWRSKPHGVAVTAAAAWLKLTARRSALNNTGSEPIGVYWFSWVPGAGFLSAKPTSVMSPSGWTDALTNNGAAIMWTTSSALADGGKLTGFSFESTETPAQLAGTFMGMGPGAGDPITTSYVYTELQIPTTITTLTNDGTRLVTTAATSGVPEPTTLGLLGLGLTGMVLGRRRMRTN